MTKTNKHNKGLASRNEVKAGYKKTKLGWIPEEWELKQFSELISISNGQVDPKLEPYKHMTLIAPNHIEQNSGQVIFYETANEQKAISGKYLVRKGELIYSKIRPYLNKVVLASDDCLCSADMYALKPQKQLSNSFLLFQLLNKPFLNIVSRYSMRTGIPKVNRQDLSIVPILLPPLPEQQKIATILSKWDESINLTQGLIQKKEIQKKGLMQQLLTGKKRLKGFSDKWIQTKIGNAFERVVKKNKENHQNVLTISAQHGLVSQSEYYNKNVSGASILGYYIIQKGDFAYNKSSSKGYPMGALKRLKKYDIGVVSTLYICFRLKQNTIDPDYFEHYSESGLMNRALRGIAQEGARSHGLLNMSVTDFFKIKLRVPPSKEEQTAIAAVLNKADEEITELKDQLVNLQLQKKGLMQQLLTGNTRVKL